MFLDLLQEDHEFRAAVRALLSATDEAGAGRDESNSNNNMTA